jgi:mannose-1-phosphate guanylyltransferase
MPTINSQNHQNRIHPLILCGGSGTRLWPLSTSKLPKQFIPLDNITLLQRTIDRTMRLAEFYPLASPTLIMNKDHDLPSELEIYKDNVIIEDYANDTAVAVANAVIEITKKINNPNDIILCLPADHYIENEDTFLHDLQEGISQLTDRNIVLFGITPTSPETKYGYVLPNGKFKEKPNQETAQNLIEQGAFWNSGIFAVSVQLLITLICTSKYDIMDWVRHPRPGKCVSFDVAILQEYDNIHVQPCSNWGWSDVGTWNAFLQIPEIKDTINENVELRSCSRVQVLNEDKTPIVMLGCSNLTVVKKDGNLLIMDNQKDYSDLLKTIALK